ncbi:alpha/beta fold hydrolase [[Mycobacterium] vasticus]|uniref:Alpha/beta hydrolase n=1 Tax=[Mycobacterium] vasticus TaxID=2875777 RepID=A0ABU5Z3D1_9MYCO|nr:alpha/beta hydrolase [Mycolicibacter sp. MYC017]MEB3070729.1 alpha/beta hydrolase [Mycolicibacter sp. MYC017]
MFSRSGTTVKPPAWFTAALRHRPDHLDVEVDACRIHVRAWGDVGNPPLVLVHGGGAHSGWWDHIAPFFCATHRVIAPDLSGHGDSGTRNTYDLAGWAQEILAASAAAGESSQRPTVIGHSMGGWVTATTAIHYGDELDSILVIDSPLRDRAPEESRLRDRKRDAPGYRTRNEIIARFTAVPSQDVTLPYISDHIARESVHKTDRGWVWKFDPAIFNGQLFKQQPTEQETMEAMLSAIRCRVAYLRCESGLVPQTMAEKIRAILQLRGPFLELAQAGHHPMLDQPLPLVATVRTLLEFWSIT